jgi:hypothetical protein
MPTNNLVSFHGLALILPSRTKHVRYGTVSVPKVRYLPLGQPRAACMALPRIHTKHAHAARVDTEADAAHQNHRARVS